MFSRVFQYAPCKCPFSALLQALQACLQYSRALYSARWSSTSLAKSSRVSSMEKSTYFTIFSHISLNDHNQRRMILLLSSEALPFFLLLIDLSKACALAKFALSSSSQVRQKCSLIVCRDVWSRRPDRFVMQPPCRMKWGITFRVAWQYWGPPSLWMLWWSAWWSEWGRCQVHTHSF